MNKQTFSPEFNGFRVENCKPRTGLGDTTRGAFILLDGSLSTVYFQLRSCTQNASHGRTRTDDYVHTPNPVSDAWEKHFQRTRDCVGFLPLRNAPPQMYLSSKKHASRGRAARDTVILNLASWVYTVPCFISLLHRPSFLLSTTTNCTLMPSEQHLNCFKRFTSLLLQHRWRWTHIVVFARLLMLHSECQCHGTTWCHVLTNIHKIHLWQACHNSSITTTIRMSSSVCPFCPILHLHQINVFPKEVGWIELLCAHRVVLLKASLLLEQPVL